MGKCQVQSLDSSNCVSYLFSNTLLKKQVFNQEIFSRPSHALNSPAMSSLFLEKRLREFIGLSLELKSVIQSRK